MYTAGTSTGQLLYIDPETFSLSLSFSIFSSSDNAGKPTPKITNLSFSKIWSEAVVTGVTGDHTTLYSVCISERGLLAGLSVGLLG